MKSNSHKRTPQRYLTAITKILASSCFLSLLTIGVAAQQKQPSPQPTPDDVIRVSTRLVQTNVTVTDKKGNFVDNLTRDDFELLVDGKRQPITFFEIIKAGESASSGSINRAGTTETGDDIATRSILVFVDDLHLSAPSMERTRKMLDFFIDQKIGYGDQVLIASPSGQVGFLQQLTDSKEALHAAVARLKFRPSTARDIDKPPMSEFQAASIERGDSQLMDHFSSLLVQELFANLYRSNPTAAYEAAERLVHARASRTLTQSNFIVRGTLSSLESLMRSVGELPGRKLVIVVSDGFLLNSQQGEISERLREVSDAALRSGGVIYGIQASGLNTTFLDAASSDMLDPHGNTGTAPLGEDSEVQAPLVELAAATGGRALLNANDLNPAITRALAETADYYLLGWRPEDEILKKRSFHRIKVVLKNQPKLSTRVNSGFFSEPTLTNAATTPVATAAGPQEQLHTAITNVFHTSLLPTNVTVNYMESSAGPKLSMLVHVPLTAGDGSMEPAVDISGLVLDDAGKYVTSFGDHFTATSEIAGASAGERSITYLNEVVVKPGLYEIRVAARDSASGRIGRVIRWIEVPDVPSGKLALSSLVLGERESEPTTIDATARARMKVDNHFSRKSRLRLLTYLYNAGAAGKPAPQMEVELQLLRQNKVLISSPPRKLSIVTEEDFHEFPFVQELSLSQVPRGRYVLRVVATDRLSKRRVTREQSFQVE